MNLNFAILKKTEIVCNKNKRIIWAYSFAKKRRRVFAFFKSIFLRNRSLSNSTWFYGKNRKIEKGNLYITENWLSRNEMWCAVDNYNHVCHICTERFLNSNSNEAVINKIQLFKKLPENFTYSQKLYFKYNWKEINQLLLPYKFYGRDMLGISFFIFASCEPLIHPMLLLGLLHILICASWKKKYDFNTNLVTMLRSVFLFLWLKTGKKIGII